MPDPLLDRPSWAPRWIPSVDDVGAMRALRWVLGAVFVAGLTACVVENADSPADPELGTDDPVVSGSIGPDGTNGTNGTNGTIGGLAARFGTIVVDLATASGEMVELCLLNADVPEERAQGLMGVTDLEGHDGMLFGFDQDVESSFVMIDTVTPLSISWWTADGAFVSGTDMEPCTEDNDAACARFPAAGPYRYAIEVFQGQRPGLAGGSTISVRDGSSCQTP